MAVILFTCTSCLTAGEKAGMTWPDLSCCNDTDFMKSWLRVVDSCCHNQQWPTQFPGHWKNYSACENRCVKSSVAVEWQKISGVAWVGHWIYRETAWAFTWECLTKDTVEFYSGTCWIDFCSAGPKWGTTNCDRRHGCRDININRSTTVKQTKVSQLLLDGQRINNINIHVPQRMTLLKIKKHI